MNIFCFIIVSHTYCTLFNDIIKIYIKTINTLPLSWLMRHIFLKHITLYIYVHIKFPKICCMYNFKKINHLNR